MDTKSRRRPRIAVPHGFHTGSLSLAEVRSTGWVPKLLPSTLLALVLLAGLASSPPAAGQVEGPPELGAGTELRTELRVEVADVEDAWLEVMSLQPRGPASADPSPPFVALVGDRSSVDAELRLTPELPGGPAMVCAGAAGMAVGCERVYLHVGDGSRLPPPEAADLVIDVSFTGGVGVTGRYLLGGVAVPGAQVAVFPADLNAEVAYTLPLGWRVSSTGDSAGGGRLVRTAETDGDGRFLVPPLVGGRYVLETVLPSGRVHRSPPFEVPVVEPNLDSGPDETPAQGTGSSPGGGPDGEGAGVVSSSPAEGTAAPSSDPDKAAPPEGASELEREGAVDLGDFEVAEGLAVRFVVRDPFGDPIEGAVVSGRQGSTVHTLATYEARTNAEGDAALAGFTVGSPVRLTCGAEGYGTISTDYELVPVEVDCELAPLASIRGELAGVGGDVPPGAALSLYSRAEDPLPDVDVPGDGAGVEGSPAAVVRPVEGGDFVLAGVEPGSYRLVAVAPGHAAEVLDLSLLAGEARDLGVLVLSAGRRVVLRAVDAATDGPVVGAAVRSLSPPSAADTVTDGDGEASIHATGVAATYSVSAEGYVEETVALATDALDDLEVRLRRAGWVRVLVRDGSGPCAGCRLRLVPGGDELTTDARGEALSPPLAPGNYKVLRPRFEHLGSVVVEQRAAEIRWARVREDDITTVVFDDRDGSVHVRFEPSLTTVFGDDRVSLMAWTPSRSQRVEPEAEGGFRIQRRRGEELALFAVVWDAGAGAETRVRQFVIPSSWSGSELTVPVASAQIQGRFRGFGGDETFGAQRLRLWDFHDRSVVAELHSRPDGSFHVPHLPPGTYSLYFGGWNVQLVSVSQRQSLDLGTVFIPVPAVPPAPDP